ncbi:FRG domain-containing protein [Mesorhizobium sp. M0772]|uniref:FRG domain-containing protein n=1 Tax=Mesorhizobium sp. M0772 TaxID=2956998 RepID=UPI0033358745
MDKEEPQSDKKIAELLGAKQNALGILGRPMPGGFIQYDAPDLMTAVALAADFKAGGHYKYFRGQRDASWQVVSSFVRANDADRTKAVTDFGAFYSFARGAPHLVPYLQNDDALIATAQHHGLALTNFIDFTRSPEVAGWFASDGASTEDKGAIFLVDREAEGAFDAYSGPVRFIHLDVPNLWRLQAQEGLFLEAPGKFDHIWPLDRIVFPHIASHSSIPRRNIYPDKKSALELALDQYSVMRRRRAGFDDLLEHIHAAGGLLIELSDDDNTTEEDALVVPPAWIAGPNERWKDIDVDSSGPVLAEPLLNSIAALTEVIEKRRGCTDLVTVSAGDDEKLQNLIDRVWGGMRPHPYSADHIARCIIATINLQRAFQNVNLSNGLEQRRIAETLLGPTTEIEMSTSGENAARAFVNLQDLWLALKQDVRDKWGPVFDPHGDWLDSILGEDWQRPGRNFDGQQLVELFVVQIIPWQVATYRDPVAFSAFHVLTLGRA